MMKPVTMIPKEEKENDSVICCVVRLSLIAEAVGPLDVAAIEGQQDADQDGQAEEVHQKGEDEVECPPEEGPAERFCDVKLRGVESRSEDEDQKTKEDEPVHDSGIGFPEGLHLDKPIDQERFHPLGKTVQPRLRFAEGDPHPPPPVDAVGEDEKSNRREDKEEGFKSLGIPEDLPALISD